MTLFNRISSLVKNLFRKNRVERDLDEEVLAHLEMLVDEKIAAGLSPVEARRAAGVGSPPMKCAARRRSWW